MCSADEHDRQYEQEKKSLASTEGLYPFLYSYQSADCDCKGKTITKKSGKNEAPVGPDEANTQGR
jgi:hypothetical protein